MGRLWKTKTNMSSAKIMSKRSFLLMCVLHFSDGKDRLIVLPSTMDSFVT